LHPQLEEYTFFRDANKMCAKMDLKQTSKQLTLKPQPLWLFFNHNEINQEMSNRIITDKTRKEHSQVIL
jgi:hypothetical protein